ncbi:MAG: hypothetical protein WC822_03300 [Candidatus Paceibacterota bacterium]|jgi:hypothetical protein
MNNQNKFIKIIIILILLLGNIFFAVRYLGVQKENKVILENQKINDKVLVFSKLFVEKVLKSEKEVDFQTRLELENSVRDLKNEEILTQWQKFVESKTEIDAQVEVKNLLEMLINNIKS